MTWQIEFEETAKKEFRRLDHQVKARILRYLKERIAKSENPCDFGDPLRRNLSGLWKYRVGDYRLICDIQGEKLVVLVVRIGHRREVYREVN